MTDLSLAAFQKFSTTVRPDPAEDLSLATITHMARGLQGPAEAELFIPREVESPLMLTGSDRLVIYDGLTAVHEGMVIGRGFRMGEGAEQGVSIEAPGFWGALLAKRTIDKRWADNRLTDDVWRVDTSATATGLEKITVDRNNRLYFKPQATSFSNAEELYALGYTMPTGQTIKRVTFDYDFSETGVLPPKTVFFNDDADNANTYTGWDNLIDGRPETYYDQILTSDDFIYVALPSPDIIHVNGLRFDLGTSVNNNTSTLSLQIYNGKPVNKTPLSVRHDNGGAFTTLTNTFDANTGTSSTVTITKDDFIYVRSSEAQIMGLKFDLGGTVNAVECNLRVQRYNADTSSWTSVSLNENQVETKGTNDMIPLSQDGSILWNPDVATSTVTINGTAGMWWRLSFSNDLTASIVINEVYILTGWETLSITDSTRSGAATMAIDGNVTFATEPDELAELRINDVRSRWLRLYVSATLDTVRFNGIDLLTIQAWRIRLQDRVGGTSLVSVTANGSGSVDHTLVTPRQTLYFEYTCLADGVHANRPALDNGTMYAEITNLMVYSETSDITLTEIARDCVGTLAADNVLNSTEIYLDVPSTPLSLEPFYTVGPESWASILSRAVAFGDGDQNEWRAHVRPSDDAPTPNGRPVLAVSQYPALTTAAYEVTPDDLDAPLELIQDFDSLVNWAIVSYQDADGRVVYLTPDDEPLLLDQASIDKWGEFHPDSALDLGSSTELTAVSLGKRYLAAHKDPKFIVSGALRIKGTIRNANGGETPVSQIKAGVNIRLSNFLDDIAQVSGAGLTFRITRVTYDDGSETAEIFTGTASDALELLLAQQALGLKAVGKGSGGGNADRRALA